MTDTPGAILDELMKLAGEQPAGQRPARLERVR